ncbi:phage regulatory CII family protein [Vibrio clamense]|uniref:phage regulatory CII family protein n=1 Tax=Vibrio clamense TaxID=2910254 RepID=UPI003D1E5372
MNGKVAMCELREPKQRAFDAVCRDFVENHNIEKLAERVGLKGTVLRSKLNPEQQYKLTPVDMALICKATGDYTIMNTVLGDLGVVVAEVPLEEGAKTLVERILVNGALSGELSSDAIKHCNAERLFRSDKRKTIAKAQAALGNLVLLINDLENRTTGLNPFLSMGIDFIANGAPIPGLS